MLASAFVGYASPFSARLRQVRIPLEKQTAQSARGPRPAPPALHSARICGSRLGART